MEAEQIVSGSNESLEIDNDLLAYSLTDKDQSVESPSPAVPPPKRSKRVRLSSSPAVSTSDKRVFTGKVNFEMTVTPGLTPIIKHDETNHPAKKKRKAGRRVGWADTDGGTPLEMCREMSAPVTEEDAKEETPSTSRLRSPPRGGKRGKGKRAGTTVGASKAADGTAEVKEEVLSDQETDSATNNSTSNPTKPQKSHIEQEAAEEKAEVNGNTTEKIADGGTGEGCFKLAFEDYDDEDENEEGGLTMVDEGGQEEKTEGEGEKEKEADSTPSSTPKRGRPRYFGPADRNGKRVYPREPQVAKKQKEGTENDGEEGGHENAEDVEEGEFKRKRGRPRIFGPQNRKIVRVKRMLPFLKEARRAGGREGGGDDDDEEGGLVIDEDDAEGGEIVFRPPTKKEQAEARREARKAENLEKSRIVDEAIKVTSQPTELNTVEDCDKVLAKLKHVNEMLSGGKGKEAAATPAHAPEPEADFDLEAMRRHNELLVESRLAEKKARQQAAMNAAEATEKIKGPTLAELLEKADERQKELIEMADMPKTLEEMLLSGKSVQMEEKKTEAEVKPRRPRVSRGGNKQKTEKKKEEKATPKKTPAAKKVRSQLNMRERHELRMENKRKRALQEAKKAAKREAEGMPEGEWMWDEGEAANRNRNFVVQGLVTGSRAAARRATRALMLAEAKKEYMEKVQKGEIQELDDGKKQYKRRRPRMGGMASNQSLRIHLMGEDVARKSRRIHGLKKRDEIIDTIEGLVKKENSEEVLTDAREERARQAATGVYVDQLATCGTYVEDPTRFAAEVLTEPGELAEDETDRLLSIPMPTPLEALLHFTAPNFEDPEVLLRQKLDSLATEKAALDDRLIEEKTKAEEIRKNNAFYVQTEHKFDPSVVHGYNGSTLYRAWPTDLLPAAGKCLPALESQIWARPFKGLVRIRIPEETDVFDWIDELSGSKALVHSDGEIAANAEQLVASKLAAHCPRRRRRLEVDWRPLDQKANRFLLPERATRKDQNGQSLADSMGYEEAIQVYRAGKQASAVAAVTVAPSSPRWQCPWDEIGEPLLEEQPDEWDEIMGEEGGQGEREEEADAPTVTVTATLSDTAIGSAIAFMADNFGV